MTAYRTPQEEYQAFRGLLAVLFREYLLWRESPSLPAHPAEWELPVLLERLGPDQDPAGRRFVLTEQGRARCEALQAEIRQRVLETSDFLPLEYLCQSLSIPWEGKLMIMCAFWASRDETMAAAVRHCNRMVGGSDLLSGLLAVALFFDGDGARFHQAGSRYLSRVFLYDGEQTCLERLSLTLRPRVLELLLGGPVLKSLPWADSYHVFEELPALCGREEQLRSLVRAVTDGTPAEIVLQGEPGSGRLFLLRHVCQAVRRNLLLVSWRSLTDQPWPDVLHILASELCLQRALCCLTDMPEAPDPARLRQLKRELSSVAPVLFFRVDADVALPEEHRRRRLWLGELDSAASRSLWEGGPLPLKEQTAAVQLAGKYHFLPGRIVRTLDVCAEQCRLRGDGQISLEQIERVCLERTDDHMGEGASRLDTGYTMEDLILPAEEKQQLQEGMDHIRYRYQVYEQWGFKHKLRYGQGLSMLFEGPPGTGKTMAASIIGNELGLPVFQVDLSRVLSKYIGETEKSLGRMFDLAEKSNAILFFDETDALFGKRSEIKDSHDKYANVETSYLLQKMEEYRGVVIMTTNLLSNIDAAFLRRISYIIHFPSPDEGQRSLLWHGVFPGQAPLDGDVDLDFLARTFEMSGAMIKSAAVSAAFLAAAQERPISMRDILYAVQKQFLKYGKRLSVNDFGPYGVYFIETTRR